MYSSRGCVENRCITTPARTGPTWSHVHALDGGARSFLFVLCTYVFYNLPVSCCKSPRHIYMPHFVGYFKITQSRYVIYVVLQVSKGQILEALQARGKR